MSSPIGHIERLHTERVSLGISQAHLEEIVLNEDGFHTREQDPATGRYSVYYSPYYRVYTADDSGTFLVDRKLSLGELVMVICLSRASEMEAKIIEMMEDLNQNAHELEMLTAIEKALLKLRTDTTSYNPDDEYESSGMPQQEDYGTEDRTWYYYLKNSLSLPMPDLRFYPPEVISVGGYFGPIDDLIPVLETAMDERNTLSQQKMLQLQSDTNKRDQTYDLVSNILKSLNSVLSGVAGNLR